MAKKSTINPSTSVGSQDTGTILVDVADAVGDLTVY